jgi:hypothetical protein
MNEELNSQISALQRQAFILLVALVCVSGTLTIFLYRQASLAGKDINALKPQAQQIIGAFNQNQALMTKFVEQLADYGKTHPDFQPVLKKYGLVGQPAAAAPAGSTAAPAPAIPGK